MKKILIKSIQLAALSTLAFACGSPGATLGGEASTEEPVQEPASDAPPDMEALLAAEVSAEEMAVLDELFASTQTPAPTSMQGRIVRWDDAFSTVDDLLRRAAALDESSIEKGYVQTVIANPVSSTQIQFWRPDTNAGYYIILQDSTPQYVFDAVSKVIREFANAQSNDCLSPNIFIPTRQSTYNALSAAAKAQSYEIRVNFVPITTPGWPCGAVPNGPKACADFPADQTLCVFPQAGAPSCSNQLRMAIGDQLWFDSGTFPSSDIPKLERIVRHEFGHAFGFSHIANSSDFIHVPGTQNCGSCISPYESIMRTESRASLSTDDLKTLRTLYSNEPNRSNDDCPYVDNFRTLAGLP